MSRVVRTLSLIVAAFAAVAALATRALAAHNTVTVAVASSTRESITGTIQVKNNIAVDQTGRLTLIVFEVKQDGSVQERDRRDLGAVDVAASGTTTVAYTVDTRRGLFDKGVFIVLADYSSAVNGNPVPHTHCGTLSVVRNF